MEILKNLIIMLKPQSYFRTGNMKTKVLTFRPMDLKYTYLR